MVTMTINDRVFEPDEKLMCFKPYVGTIINILGRPFELGTEYDCGAYQACWTSFDGLYYAYATPNFDNYKGIPVSLEDQNCEFLDGDSYPCELNEDTWFAEYCGIVKAIFGRLIEDYEKKNKGDD
jgi:hypothetical protein